MKTALVISGGGCKGAFAVGAVEWLLEKGESFDFFIGTSTGALISTLVAGNGFSLAKHIYSTVETKDLLKPYCWITLPWRKSIYNDKGLKKVIERNLTYGFFEKIQHKGLYICTVSLNTGKICYWSPRNMYLEEFQRALLASCNQPGFMPAVQIVRNGNYHVDGGVREVIPVVKAITLGADKIIVIKLSPPGVKKVQKKYDRIVPTLFRSLDLMLAEIKKNDLELPYIAKKSNVIVIEPEEELTDNSLEFIPEKMKKMMEIGYNRAKKFLP